MHMNKSMLTAYQNRWEAVAEIEAAELRQTSMAQRWQQLNALVRMAAGLGILRKADDEQTFEIHQRWNFLKDRYLAETQGRTE